MCQGTTSVVPEDNKITLGFNHCGFVSVICHPAAAKAEI
jgi:hypothetical protein